MDKFIPLIVLLVVMIIGFILKVFQGKKLIKRLSFTDEYRNKFIETINLFVNTSQVNSELYFYLTENVGAMQNELGQDGIMAYAIDPLRGFQCRDYQLLVNFLPEIREMVQWDGNSIMQTRFMNSAQNCDDMFIRHIGNLKIAISDNRKRMFNPFRNIADGIRWILWLPANILLWCGFISYSLASKLKSNFITKTLAIIITIVGLISSIVTIMLGWEQTVEMITKWVGMGR